MGDNQKTRAELLQEVETLRRRVAELEQAKETLRTRQFAMESSINAIAFVDIQGNLTYVNNSFLKFWGYGGVEEVLGKAAVLFWVDVDRAVEITEVVYSKGGWTGELVARRKDGSTFDVQLSASLVRDEAGNPVCIMASFIDITERKRAEETLRESEERWRLLAENIPDAILTIDKDGSIQFLNRTIAGFPPEHAIDTTVYEYVPADQHHIMRKAIERVFLTGKPERYEIEGVGEHGPNTNWETRLVPIIHDGQVVAVNLICTDVTERKKAEEVLRESQRWQRAILDSIPDIAWLKDKESRYIAANEPLCQAFGIKLEDFVGKTDFDISPEDLAKRYRADDKEVMKSGKRKRVEEPWGTKEGKRIWIETIKTPIYNDGGQIIGTSGIARDITERKKAEEALRESEERYKALFQGAAEGIVVADTETKEFKYVNPAICKMLGYTEEELGRLGVHDIHPKEDLQYIISEFEAQARGEKTLSSSLRCLRKDGTIMYADINTAVASIDGRQCNVGFFTDVTERREMEEVLRESQERLQLAVSGTNLGLWDWNVQTGEAVYNQQWAEMLGYALVEIEPNANSWKRLVHPDDAQQMMEILNLHFEKKTPFYEAEFRMRTKSGGWKWILSMGRVFEWDDDGNPLRMTGTHRDITERKEAEEELNEYREKMVRAEQLASLGTLSATLTHELNQPLTTIRLSIENSLADLETTSSPDTVTEGLKDGLSEVSHAASIVERFRNFARKSSEKTLSEVDLKAVAEKIVNLLGESARRTRVSLQLKGMDKLPTIYSNEKNLEQLFFAMVDNAIQAADGKKGSELIISGGVKDKQIELRFADDCGGIAPENLDKVFEPFFTTRPEGEGTGLGLCIVQRIATQAGGKVRVESKAGEGSTFFITLPINKDRQA